MKVPNYKIHNRMAFVFAIAIVGLLVFSVVRAIAAPAAHAQSTGSGGVVAQANPGFNVQVDYQMGPLVDIVANAFDGTVFVDCDSCDVLGMVSVGKQMYYSLHLASGQTLKRAIYIYVGVAIKYREKSKTDTNWNGLGKLKQTTYEKFAGVKHKIKMTLTGITVQFFDQRFPQVPEHVSCSKILCPMK